MRGEKTPPYAIVDMAKGVQTMRQHIRVQTMPHRILGQRFRCMGFLLMHSEMLTLETYVFAREHMNVTRNEDERVLMRNFFLLWFAIRRTATIDHIVGEDTLEVSPELDDRPYPWFEKIPLPPVMIQQLDMILTLGVLNPPLGAGTRRFPETFVSQQTPNLDDHQYAIPTTIKEVHHSANVFLAYYHYATAAGNPFDMDGEIQPSTPFADMPSYEIDFLRETRQRLNWRRVRTTPTHSPRLTDR
ncbi:hypothetical protein EMCG_05276 [[Emmonsia] crescens]|uniref:Uncharacterized protein n=1 Tax=[Emmonsia] crescens TaxID=73230 RepID=A0A0G2HQH0_9EURO|nr:hypothetical protein EMCG_05276 [Emmonsia crescens UAMH 3008]